MLNIRSIRKNLANYMATLYADNVEVIVLTETWLSKEKEQGCIIPGYRGHFSSNDTYRSGGVAVFVSDRLPSTKIDFEETVNCDSLIVHISFPRKKLQLVAVYRSPTSSVSNLNQFSRDNMVRIMSELRNDSHCLRMGDMNIFERPT